MILRIFGLWRWLLLVFFTISLIACDKKEDQPQLYTVKKQVINRALFFSGTIAPLHVTLLTSPADGVVAAMPFQYGDYVKAGQPLFLLTSEKFLADYKNALMQYIKDKNEFDTHQAQMRESRFLHDHQLISDNAYKNIQSIYYASQLTVLQSKNNLQIFLKRLNIKSVDSMTLTIASIDKINAILKLDINAEHLNMTAPSDGTILAPIIKNNDDNKKILPGDVVKQGDVLALIGDMSGLNVEINVNELMMNQLQLGQPIQISGPAFPNMILTGSITRIDHQAQSQTGMPVFAVLVTVPHLTKEQQGEIHVGMSANVTILSVEAPQLWVPMNALVEKQGRYYLLVKQDARFQERLVQTGKTTDEYVAILAGIKAGESILVADRT